MDFKIEEYFVSQDNDILFSIFTKLGKLFASIHKRKIASNQFIVKVALKVKCQEYLKTFIFDAVI